MNFRNILCLLILAVIPHLASAQFYLTGDDPGRLKWYSRESEHYRVIYPKGLDSLAVEYAKTLEKYYSTVGNTIGFTPTEKINSRLPVVLHAYNTRSNGSVAWAPKRMDLFTLPQTDNPEAFPWIDNLAIHESRHVVQMQTGLSGIFRPFNWFFGEMFNGFVAGFYPKIEMLEGDAVVAETALSKSGRGRSGDFLNYYMIAFDRGDFRNWEKWRFGSQRNYTPNYYTAGYLMFGGLRYVFGVPDIAGQYFNLITRRPYDLFGLDHVIKWNTGKKIRPAYFEIADSLNADFQRNIESRKPFIPSISISRKPKIYTEYSNGESFGEGSIWVKNSLSATPILVSIDERGNEQSYGAFTESPENLTWSEKYGRLYWAEDISDIRWSQRINSVIMCKNMETGKKHRLTKKGRMHYPTLSESEETLCVSEYLENGRTRLCILDAFSGAVLSSKEAPDSLQLIESLWCGDRIFATAISKEGFGIYSLKATEREFLSDEWQIEVAPLPVKIKELGLYKDNLSFTCDRTGVDEYYYLDIEEESIYRLTSTRYGAEDFVWNSSESVLFYSANRYEGNLIEKTYGEYLHKEKTDFRDIYKYPMAEALTAQEKALAAERGQKFPGDTAQIHLSAPKRYRKASHILNFHSWAPVYFNAEKLMNFTYDYFYELVSPGVAAIAQNSLGTAVTHIGYSAHKDPFDRSQWRHSGHFKFTYTGLYPVFEIQADFNDRAARRYYGVLSKYEDNWYVSLKSSKLDVPSFNGKVSVYIPFNLSSGGWQRGIVPKLSWNITNDVIRKNYLGGVLTLNEDNTLNENITKYTENGYSLMHRLTASLRAYSSLPVAPSGIYPRFGAGLELGCTKDFGAGDFLTPMGYAYLYTYFPGIIPQQGLKITAIYQQRLDTTVPFSTSAVNTLPRGFAKYGDCLAYANRFNNSVRLTADYGIPIFIGDLSLFGTVFYIRRLEVVPHFDYTFLGKSGGLFSAGTSFAVKFRSFVTLEFPITLGVRWSYNGGPSWNEARTWCPTLKRNSWDLVFDIDF